jgi:Protein of unknown function (DUF3800)
MPLTCHRTIMLKVYIDESGIHDGSPVVTVGAYLARPKQWAAFTEEWSRAIKPINVYRAADAASCRGEFKGWSKVEVAALAERVLPIIPKHTELAMAAGINLRDYAAALKGRDHLRRQLGEPYGACLHWVLSRILRMKVASQNREQIAFFHENNDYAGEANATYHFVVERWGKGARTSFKFGPKEKYVPLQAADIYAYECNKRLRDPTAPNRKALEALVPNKNKAGLQYYNRDNMDNLVRSLERYHQREANRAPP